MMPWLSSVGTGWKYYVVEPHKKNKRIKNYGNNFHWSRRVRKPMK